MNLLYLPVYMLVYDRNQVWNQTAKIWIGRFGDPTCLFGFEKPYIALSVHEGINPFIAGIKLRKAIFMQVLWQNPESQSNID